MGSNNGRESVATMWGRLVAEAARGEVVGLQDKWGKDVAVMMSVEMYEALQQRIIELEGRAGEIS